jgi:2,3-bisphosphoglycerate-independent phosphoglycerate mutase
MMKQVVLLCDGMADHALPALGGKTPMQAARKPAMDGLAAKSKVGLAWTGVKELPMGSDVGNMAVLGYDPRKYYSGRAPLEAKAMGVELKKNEVVFRCNLVHVAGGQMEDYSAGQIGTDDAKPLVRMLDERLGSKTLRFIPGIQYRHLAVLAGAGFEEALCVAPHDIMGQPIEGHLPRGKKGSVLKQLMLDSQLLLEGHEINRERRREGKKTANMAWMWGQGKGIQLPDFKGLRGLEGGVISAVDLVRGLGMAAGLEVIKVPGTTGWLDTNWSGKAEAALKFLKKHDFVYVHLEATDEAGHQGDPAAKVQAIELIDNLVLAPILKGLQDQPFRILIMPDHPTPCDVRTHTYEPVPYLYYDSSRDQAGPAAFDELSAQGRGEALEAWTLMDTLAAPEPVPQA